MAIVKLDKKILKKPGNRLTSQRSNDVAKARRFNIANTEVSLSDHCFRRRS